MKKNESLYIALAGPSGVGKSTITDGVLRLNKHFVKAMTYTTRPKRHLDDKEYNFISLTEFHRLLTDNFFFEVEEIFSNYYGVPNHILSNNFVFFNVDVKGAQKLKETLEKKGKIICIFIAPPSLEELSRRLIKRGENSEQIEKRLERATREINMSSTFDFVIVNHILEQSIKKVHSIISSYDSIN